MPFISEAASAIKSRLGFHDRPAASDSGMAVQSTPVLLKSVSRENLTTSQLQVATSAVRRIGDYCDDDSNSNSGLLTSTAQKFDFSEDPSFWKEHNVQVIIRIRPLSSSEISVQGHSMCVRQESSQMITWTGQPESRFTFDLVADESVSQEQLFKVAGLPMVENCVAGYNSCMFAYGQTGSGKTYTMLGDIEGGTRRHSIHCGMTPRVFEHLFSRIQKEKEARKDERLKFTCRCSFLEIYNEQILDLLDPSSNNLQIREDVKKGVYVENLKEIEVTSARDVIQQLIQGAANRKVAATNMNRASSRSHSVFTCIVESKWESQGVTHHRFARLNLVDLAGSERQKSSGAEGERLKEATNINKSLSTLGLVIMNLVSISNGKSLHVPYRDSKLTFLLQDSLGGNAKTIMIANISPSLCCSLETLSTLKFGQRAKFIKNNAIINEDASGDVIAMRIQIQQLKKEVSRLRGLANGETENLDNDMLVQSIQGTPGPFSGGLQGSFSPLVSSKKMSQKDYEVALVGAYRREKDKDVMLKALSAENQAAVQLAKQREDEIQSLKMRLRLREAGIKRLEAVASGKISAETHWLKEKEEHLKEIEVLRTQVDRNQEVTRFAMENLRLKEEIRRLKSFYEEGERDLMSEQITVLQNKLLEALDWKLMHEADSLVLQKENSNVDKGADGDFLSSSQEPGSPWQSSTNEEIEFLRMQAIHNQREINSLNKQLDLFIEEKEKQERQINELKLRLEEEKSSRTNVGRVQQSELPAMTVDASAFKSNDQMELKTMVDAIAAASQREAEAHEKEMILSKENEELQLKLELYIEENNDQQAKIKALIEEKNSLIELYERAGLFSGVKNLNKVEETEVDDVVVHNDDHSTELAKVQDNEVDIVKNLEQQLMEMHEENEKLMGLYEKAMHERDEFKRMLSSSGGNNTKSTVGLDCPEKLVEVDGGKRHAPCIPPGDVGSNYSVDESECIRIEAETMSAEEITDPMEVQEYEFASAAEPPQNVESDRFKDQTAFPGFDVHQKCNLFHEDTKADAGNQVNHGIMSDVDKSTARFNLETAHENLSDSSRTTTLFSSFERLLKEIDETEKGLQFKQDQFGSLKSQSPKMKERKALTDRKLSALKNSLSYFTLSSDYFEQREARRRERLDSSLSYLHQKKQELISLQALKCEVDNSLEKKQQSDAELRDNLMALKTKLEVENQRLENEKVIFAKDNIENVNILQRNWVLGGKATELLKSEEEKTKLHSEIKLTKEELGIIRKEQQELHEKSKKLESQMQIIEMEIQKAQKSLEEIELSLQNVIQEKETILEMKQKGRSEIEFTILECQQNVFDADLKEAEMEILEEELTTESRKLADLKAARVATAERMSLEIAESDLCLLSEKMQKELDNARASVVEATKLLG